MRKLILLTGAMLALALVAAVPAIAQVEQENEQEGESGDVDQSFTVTGSGTSADQCAAILSAAQSGNSQNSAGVIQSDGSEADDIEVEDSGSSIDLSPEVAEECEQTINQAAVASPAPEAAPAPKSEEKESETPEAEEKESETPKSEAKKSEAKKELPRTGGGTTLFALSVGALLVTGGLLVRRIVK